jgi:hypothetical protein
MQRPLLLLARRLWFGGRPLLIAGPSYGKYERPGHRRSETSCAVSVVLRSRGAPSATLPAAADSVRAPRCSPSAYPMRTPTADSTLASACLSSVDATLQGRRAIVPRLPLQCQGLFVVFTHAPEDLAEPLP